MNTIFSIFRQDLRLVIRDPTPFATLFLMPAMALFLFTPSLGAALREQGYYDASGIELALPGMAVMFGSLGAAFLGFAIFREHQWQSWQRLLVSGSPLSSILVGKTLVPTVLVFGQQVILLLLVLVFYQTPLPTSLLSYLINSMLFAINVATIGLVVASFARSLQQMNAIIHISSIVLAATSGAFIAIDKMPMVIEYIAYFTPSYWLVKSQLNVLLSHGSISTSFPSIIILGSQSIIFMVIALSKYRSEEKKYNWA